MEVLNSPTTDDQCTHHTTDTIPSTTMQGVLQFLSWLSCLIQFRWWLLHGLRNICENVKYVLVQPEMLVVFKSSSLALIGKM